MNNLTKDERYFIISGLKREQQSIIERTKIYEKSLERPELLTTERLEKYQLLLKGHYEDLGLIQLLIRKIENEDDQK